MKECVVCGKMIKKVDSVMTIDYVCSIACKDERQKTIPKKVSITSKSYWIDQGYTEEDAKTKVSELQSQRSPRHPLYWTSRGFTDQEATDKVSEIQRANGKRNSELYTKEELQARTAFSPVYWVNLGYSEEEAIAITKANSDSISIDAFIKRNGEEEGTRLYNEHCEKMKHSNSFDGFIERYGEEEGERMWMSKYVSRVDSKVAKNFFDAVIAEIPTGFNVYVGGEGKKEFGVRNLENNKYYLYDFVIPKLKVCVEFNGDYWHCNPTKYQPDYYHTQANKYATDIWAYDQLKIDTMTKYRGYDTTVVWESEAKAMLPEVISMINERYAIVKAESPHLFEDDVSATEPISENDT
jgi:hypothetical protein